MKKVTWKEFADRYCERQEQTPEGLLLVLNGQRLKFSPDGWFIAECQMLDSSYLGSLVVVPYGPQNSFKTIPTTPFSPRGLASDQSVAVAYLEVGDLPGN